jgi:hypothetical protein
MLSMAKNSSSGKSAGFEPGAFPVRNQGDHLVFPQLVIARVARQPGGFDARGPLRDHGGRIRRPSALWPTVSPPDELEKAPHETGIVVRVDHDRGSLTRLGEGHERRIESLVAAAVAETQGAPAVVEQNPEPARSFLRGEILACHARRDHAVTTARERFLDLDGEAGEISGRRPQPGRGHLGIHVPAAPHGRPVRVIAGSGERRARRGLGLLERAAGHAARPSTAPRMLGNSMPVTPIIICA